MALRAISPNMAPTTVSDIDVRLVAIQAENSVSIPLAIESGSRAWGFPSPDSDYDCRFVFVRSLNQYLTPWQRRDVIETPLESVFDSP
jgi:predicted nucleotidyltransferase